VTNFLRVLLGMLLALAVTAASAQKFAAVPPLQAQVTDTAGMLTAAQRSALENVLNEYRTRTGSEIAILLVKSTEPEAIEQYGIRVAEAWKVGRKGIDDGAILIVAKDNPKALRRLRIEAGRGVQGVLTDAQSKRILEDVIAPHFRQNDFYGGLAAGVSSITTLLDKERFAPPAKKAQATQKSDEGSGFGWLPLLFIFFVILSMRGSRRGSRSLSGNGWGNAAGVILGSMIGNQIGRGGGGGFGGGGGGGFSGGGGTFDGGGASGDW
jgi:uncharacterized protein